MSSTSKKLRFRIVEDMGFFKIQEAHTTVFGKVKWGTWQHRSMCDPHWSYDQDFETLKDARAYLADMLAAWKKDGELKSRGPVVVLEVTE